MRMKLMNFVFHSRLGIFFIDFGPNVKVWLFSLSFHPRGVNRQ